jgi:Tol biopolymer transport system component
VWFDRSGKTISTVGAPEQSALGDPQLSPDGKYVAFDRSVDGNRDVWLLEVGRNLMTRFTFTPGSDVEPVWSPDGSRLAYASIRGTAVYDVLVRRTNGVGAEEVLIQSPVSKYLEDWSSDGKFLLFRPADLKTGRDLTGMSVEDRKPFAVANTEFEEKEGQFSPDGRWVLYQSNDSGRFEIYIQPFPTAGGRTQISTVGGEHPRWRRDGKELYYIASDGVLMAVPVSLPSNEQRVEAGTPVALFKPRIMPAVGGNRQQYVVTADGQRFLVVVPEEATVASIAVVQNWTKALQK